MNLPLVPTDALEPPQAVALEGTRVRLEPLSMDHVTGLQDAVRDGSLWEIPYATHVATPDAMAESVESLCTQVADGDIVAWAVRRLDTDQIIGQTTFLNISLRDRRLEIGSTWMAESTHGTGMNAEVKLLLLTHAFETLGCLGVELRTHHLNVASRRAIERLGAKQDGILRAHWILPDGTLRDTVVYSILEWEWPAVRAALTRRAVARRAPGRTEATG